MPIIKIPVVHNFGIISQTHQEDLQRRLLKKAQELEASQNAKISPSRNPFEITEEFIKKYNSVQEPEEQEHSVDQARKMLRRSMRRAGLNSQGQGDHVDFPLAWTELLLLALCRGKIQDESLDVLLISLDQAPVHDEHAPVLFYLAESVLYWLCTDTVQKPFLYSSEVKMLKLGHLIFLRLFLLHKSNCLNGYTENKFRLLNFLKALTQCEPCYKPFPNVLFAVHFILQTGEIMCECDIFMKKHSIDSVQPSTGSPSQYPGEVDQKDDGVNQVLWHCLVSWYCVQNNIKQLKDVLQHLVLLQEELQQKNWVDSGLGLVVLGEAGKSSLLCLQALLDLAVDCGQDGDTQQKKGAVSSAGLSAWPWQLKHIYVNALADICLHGSHAEIQKTALVRKRQPKGQNEGGLLSILEYGTLSDGISDEETWCTRYSAIHAVVKICHVLHGDVAREGLRNAAWKALQEQLGKETDLRVLEATRVAEAEVNSPKNPFSNVDLKTPSNFLGNDSFQFISLRVAATLSQLHIPPIPLKLPLSRWAKKEISPPRACHPKQQPVKNKAPQLTLRQEILLAEASYEPSIDFNTRTELHLMDIVKDQWGKELQMKLKEEEENENKQLQEKERQAEEHFKEIMRKREEKLNKKTKPYELPGIEKPANINF
uniref:Transmembrane protein 232 n=1 Tax=Lepisosteus oculatus TaxID=7918 RepID=W5MWK2_LEPOC|nr:PREDICTED: transmembrane protein 232 isoform X1 [Lepisosteus oculatus]XP_015193418.1 PREDICTED: transmembrane protein 232 isoform X1 [Lepisosteus oculatus]XP_015193424.1 PREDICTED: transmembrane protein 232 isoform X1 [Lepisosteus oculatus]